MEVLSSIAATVVNLLVEPIGRHICYPFKYDTNMEKLQEVVRRLIDQREMVKHAVDDARQQREEIEKTVMDWMACVHEFLGKVPRLIIDDKDKAGMLCCFNLMTFYSLSKEVVEATKHGISLLEEGNFARVSYRPVILPI